MKSEFCPYLEIKDSPIAVSRKRLDTTCRMDCPLNGATFLGPTESPTSLSAVYGDIEKMRRNFCSETSLGRALEGLKKSSEATKKTNSS